MRAPNSTPIVRSCTGWKRLSVNWSRRHDLPTPAVEYLLCVIFESISLIEKERQGPFTEDMGRNYEKIVSVHLNK